MPLSQTRLIELCINYLRSEYQHIYGDRPDGINEYIERNRIPDELIDPLLLC